MRIGRDPSSEGKGRETPRLLGAAPAPASVKAWAGLAGRGLTRLGRFRHSSLKICLTRGMTLDLLRWLYDGVIEGTVLAIPIGHPA